MGEGGGGGVVPRFFVCFARQAGVKECETEWQCDELAQPQQQDTLDFPLQSDILRQYSCRHSCHAKTSCVHRLARFWPDKLLSGQVVYLRCQFVN